MLCDYYQYAKHHTWIGRPFGVCVGGGKGPGGFWGMESESEGEVRRRLMGMWCLTRSTLMLISVLCATVALVD